MAFPSFGCDVDDLVRPSAAFVPVVCDPNTKRHAAYFPADFDLDAQMRMCALEEEDDASSFLFRAPRVSKRSKKRPQSIAVMEVTPAQEIANRYRAGLKVGEDDSRSSSSSTLVEGDSLDESRTRDEDETSGLTAPLSVPNIRFRQSRVDILKDLREEALGEMRRLGVDEEHPLVCPRNGCRETLNNLRALTRHLHMHDICKDKSFKCYECRQRFNTRDELKTHSCAPHCKSAPTSPIYATFGSILSKITSLN